MNAQLKRGVLDICILQLLRQEDRYGYDMIKKLQNYFPDTDESTLYAILRRLHTEGATELYYSEQSNGPKRKYYKLTENGEETLKDYLESVQTIKMIFEEIGIYEK